MHHSFASLCLFAGLVLLSTACVEEGGGVDTDWDYDACYQADTNQESANRCMDPFSVTFSEYNQQPHCDQSSDTLPVLSFLYGIKTIGSNDAKIYSDGNLLGTGTVTGRRISYDSPTFLESRPDGEIEWRISGWMEWYDGQGGENPCPGLGLVSVPDAGQASYCLAGEETVWVLDSTVEDIPQGSSQSTCNQRFVYSGEKLEK